MKPPNIFRKFFPEFREARPFGMREFQPIFCVLVIDDKDHLNFQHSSLRFQTISTCFDHIKNTNVMKTQDFVKEVSDRNNPLKKLADKIVSNIDSVSYFRNDPALNTRLGVIIDWSKGTMLIEPNRK